MPHVRDDRPVVIVEKSSGGLGGFLLGLIVGAGAALLLAPQSGEETREVLRTRGRRLRADIGAKAGELQDRVEHGFEKAKERVEEEFESARQTLKDKRAGAQDALEAGKSAVHSARDELERKLAESRSARSKARPSDDETNA
ncbi:MAG: hypothetical protein GTN62_07085 [Gemmatimonadales bacterium]|nr:hypothetical protein [Gemmatimonadales bacterium]NIN11264.1 hypothetical protein [Gemmatimonadales bacterium]NIN49863.1 hypothetical protein [Gemmatimonadales bacterium]NIP07327.1 hypothetical protein [Gemmatimonadales bacterium]NIR03022.1 hypothetical protein [Gemmatimonadales bacterium]